MIEQCRILIWAMITTWRWRRDDQLPNGRYWAIEGLNQLRVARAATPNRRVVYRSSSGCRALVASDSTRPTMRNSQDLWIGVSRDELITS